MVNRIRSSGSGEASPNREALDHGAALGLVATGRNRKQSMLAGEMANILW
jgi:hypothetical protein